MQEVPQSTMTGMTGLGVGGRIRDERSVGELFRELADESRSLVQQEIQLAKAEMNQKLDRVTNSAASIGAGGAVAFAGVITLCAAASAGLFVILGILGVPFTVNLWLAPLIVGALISGIGYALIQGGVVNLKKTRLTPKRTADSLRETKEWMQEKMR
jgi:predicted phage tail protein